MHEATFSKELVNNTDPLVHWCERVPILWFTVMFAKRGPPMRGPAVQALCVV